ncbi:glycosyltransferase family 2 protein [Actinocorallia longicatena]|uniref:Glycosyltransferase family 2 protein n=1 Tax=Actinocorallia longicatena TaxID=111803 RepID=A0ABP6QKU0_9ACTN
MTALSVVIAVRDVERYVTDLLLSLARNTRNDIEFIVVDDGSIDRTPEIVTAAKIPGLTLLRHARPLGPGAARNTGLAASTGRHITYLDGDDWIRPGYLYELLAAIEALGCDFVMSDHVRVTDTGRVVRRTPQGRRREVLRSRDGILPVTQPSMVDYPYTWAGVYSRSLADRGLLTFDPALHTAEDRPWFWRLYREPATYATVALRGVFYRRTPGSLTQRGDARMLHFFDAFDRVLRDLDDDPEPDRYRAKALTTYFAMIAFHLSRRDRLPAELQRVLTARARSTISAVPPETRTQLLPSMTEYRQDLFASLLGIRV